MLIAFGGLPGVGKTALAHEIAQRLRAVYPRVDAIEAALWRAGVARDQPTGLAAYVVARTVAEGSREAGASVSQRETWDKRLVRIKAALEGEPKAP